MKAKYITPTMKVADLGTEEIFCSSLGLFSAPARGERGVLSRGHSEWSDDEDDYYE